MVAKKKTTKKVSKKKTTRKAKVPAAPTFATPDMGKMMETAMGGMVAITGITVMGGVMGSALQKLP